MGDGSWGTGEWGLGPWGGAGETDLGPPTLAAVSSAAGTAPGGGALVDVLGGEVITIVGSGFEDPMVVEVLSGVSPDYDVRGVGYIFDPRYDLNASRIYAGTPKLPQGLYHLRLTKDDGSSAILENALAYEPFAHQLKVERVRIGFARVWTTGLRLLRG